MRKVQLCRVPGVVLTIEQFLDQYLSHFGLSERNTVFDRALFETASQFSRQLLNKSAQDFISLGPWARADSEFGLKADTVNMDCRRSGKRSAFLPDLAIKIKGCRLMHGSFPSWDLKEDFSIGYSQIPAGTMTESAIFGEILGFQILHSLAECTPTVPLAVFKYVANDKPALGLVFSVVSDERIESRVRSNLSLVECINGFYLRSNGEPKEVSLENVSSEYSSEKARSLCAIHFKGLFRGILNSNIGNDIIVGGKFCGLCDFDSSYLMPLPESKTEKSKFIRRCFLEVIKSSLPIEGYVVGKDETEFSTELVRIYTQYSSLYKQYYIYFLEKISALGWDTEFSKREIRKTLITPTALLLLKELIPNGETVRSFSQVSNYEPHNVSLE